jgi:methylenetetrahydrofolate dehydrogenase (NADP+)/methenyltetrahydrofolate cyclohydrolase
MHAIQLSSKALSDRIRTTIKDAIQAQKAQGWRPPKLVMVQMGEEFASVVYVRNKAKACEKIGMASQIIPLPITDSEANLLELIDKLNADASVDGILVQLPLPSSITVSKVLDAIDPLKDVDGFHPENMGLLAQGRPRFRPCTPYGIMRLLGTLSIPLKGMHAVIIGASHIVGKPMMLELLRAECTVTICHVATRNLAHHIKQADLLVSAIGKTNIIQSKWIKPDAIVVDAGINRSEAGITGDIDFNTAAERAYAITPVPGGVGPMTVAMLLENTWSAYQARMDTLDHHASKSIIT